MSDTYKPCAEGCPGWAMFETNKAPFLEIERCDECDRFEHDKAACAHVLWLISRAMTGEEHCHLVRLMSSGGTPAQWEELDT